MNFGKTVNIYLLDGSPTGLKIVEISNWSGKAFAFYRTNFAQIKNREELSYNGVYLLIGKDTDSSKDFRFYVGQSEDPRQRIQQHDLEKDFWNQAVIFTRQTNTLSKGKIVYLEQRTIEKLRVGDRIALENAKGANTKILSESDREEMEEYLYYIFVILGTLGFPNVDKPIDRKEKTYNEKSLSLRKFYIRSKSLSAEMVVEENGYVLIKGSELNIKETPTLKKKYSSLRKELLQKTKIALNKEKTKFVLKDNYEFSSPSAASDFVLGYSSNGREEWRTEDKLTFSQVEENMTK